MHRWESGMSSMPSPQSSNRIIELLLILWPPARLLLLFDVDVPVCDSFGTSRAKPGLLGGVEFGGEEDVGDDEAGVIVLLSGTGGEDTEVNGNT